MNELVNYAFEIMRGAEIPAPRQRSTPKLFSGNLVLQWRMLFVAWMLVQGCGTAGDYPRPDSREQSLRPPARMILYGGSHGDVSVRALVNTKQFPPPAPKVSSEAVVPAHTGVASWYGPRFNGRKTASGVPFNDKQLTAAHRSLPLGCRVKVTHLNNGNSVEVEINDRGPYVEGRVIDLSKAAAKALDMIEEGVAKVRVEVLD